MSSANHLTPTERDTYSVIERYIAERGERESITVIAHRLGLNPNNYYQARIKLGFGDERGGSKDCIRPTDKILTARIPRRWDPEQLRWVTAGESA